MVKNITSYFDYKLETLNLFDKAICAFKIDNKIVDVNFKHNKNINYLINCTIIPKNTEICFIDNSYYNEMLDQRVYYIQPINYNHNLSKQDIINRFMKSQIGKYIVLNSNVNIDYKSFLTDWFYINTNHNLNHRIKMSNNQCIEITKKILYHIKEFFYINNINSKTKKNRVIGNFTRKNKKY